MRLCHAAGSHSIGGSWHASVPIGDFCQTELRPSFCLIGIWKTHEPESQQAVEAVSLALRDRDVALTEGQRGTLERLEEIRGLLAESSESERQLVGPLVEFRDMMGGMSAATERLSEAVERIEARETDRVNEVVKAIGGIKSSVVAVGVIATSCAVIAILIGFAALIF